MENGLENPHEATLINPNQSEIMMEHFMIMSYNVSIVTRQLAYGNEGTFMRRQFLHAVEENPIIAAVKDNEGLEKACKMGELTVIFVLYGDICSIGGIVNRIQQAGKLAMVHMDLVTGLSAKEVSVDYLRDTAGADGIITTKAAMTTYAKEQGLYTVLRFFVIDSLALQSIENLGKQRGAKPDFIEVLPGVMPKVIRKICTDVRIPVIAGGLIADKEDVMGALAAGAAAVSTTNQAVWTM